MGVGPPCSVAFRVSFHGYCALPPDILNRTPSVPSVAHESSAERVEVRTHNVPPPVRLSVGRVRIGSHPRQNWGSSSSSPGARRSDSPRLMRSPGPPVTPVLMGSPTPSLVGAGPPSSLTGTPRPPRVATSKQQLISLLVI